MAGPAISNRAPPAQPCPFLGEASEGAASLRRIRWLASPAAAARKAAPSELLACPRPEVLEKLQPFPQAPPQHLGAARHLHQQCRDLGGTEVEPPVEGLHRVEDLRMRQVRVAERGHLHATP